MYIYMYINIYVYIYIHIYVCIYIEINTHTHININTCIHTYIVVYTYTFTHTYIQELPVPLRGTWYKPTTKKKNEKKCYCTHMYFQVLQVSFFKKTMWTCDGDKRPKKRIENTALAHAFVYNACKCERNTMWTYNDDKRNNGRAGKHCTLTQTHLQALQVGPRRRRFDLCDEKNTHTLCDEKKTMWSMWSYDGDQWIHRRG